MNCSNKNRRNELLGQIEDLTLELNTAMEELDKLSLPIVAVGDWFVNSDEGYGVLVQVDYGDVVLACIRGGNRWYDPVKVVSPRNITQKELNDIIKSSSQSKWIPCHCPIEET